MLKFIANKFAQPFYKLFIRVRYRKNEEKGKKSLPAIQHQPQQIAVNIFKELKNNTT